MATASVTDLLTVAMRKIGALGAGRAPTAQEILDGRKDFDALLEDWRFNDLMVVANTISQFALQSKNSYTIYASVAADFNTERPVSVHSAVIIGAAGLRTPLLEMTGPEYMAETNRTTIATPSRYVYLPTFPSGTIAFDTIPIETLVEFELEQPLITVPTDNAVDMVFAPGFYDAIVYNLAIRIAAEHDITPSNILLAMAAKARAMIEKRNFSVPRTSPQGPGSAARRHYDINAGP